MPKFLIAHSDGRTGEILEREWENPRVISEYWFGEKGDTAYAISTVFEDTPENRKYLQEWQSKLAEAQRLENEADAMMYKHRGVDVKKYK